MIAVPDWLSIGWEVAKLAPEAITLVRDIVAAIKDDPSQVTTMRAKLLGQAAGSAAYQASHNAGRKH